MQQGWNTGKKQNSRRDSSFQTRVSWLLVQRLNGFQSWRKTSHNGAAVSGARRNFVNSCERSCTVTRNVAKEVAQDRRLRGQQKRKVQHHFSVGFLTRIPRKLETHQEKKSKERGRKRHDTKKKANSRSVQRDQSRGGALLNHLTKLRLGFALDNVFPPHRGRKGAEHDVQRQRDSTHANVSRENMHAIVRCMG